MYLLQLNVQADRIGDATLRMAAGVRRYFMLLWYGVLGVISLGWLRRPAVLHVLVRQIYFTGVQSLVWVLVMILFAGVLSVFNIVAFAKGIEDLSKIGMLIGTLLVQEVAPLLITIFLLARSGVAVVTEIANMHIRGEDLLLGSLGIDRQEYLYLPRMMAFALCGVVLTFMFVALSIWFGGLVVAWQQEMNLGQFLVEVKRSTGLSSLLMMAGKGFFYPLLCCVLLIDQGCRVGRDPNEIPVRSTNGVVWSLMMIILLDVVIGILWSFL